MTEEVGAKFQHIIKEIIDKSLFTERQIEILLDSKGLRKSAFAVSRGAYYRQSRQSRDKLVKFYYTAVLLRGLGVLLPDDLDVMSRLAEQISVIQNGEITEERETEILNVVDKIIRQASNV